MIVCPKFIIVPVKTQAMNSTVKNILILIDPPIVGGIVNMGIVMLSGSIIPAPAGVDPSNIESSF